MKEEYKSLVDNSFKEAKDFEKSAFVVPYDIARKLEDKIKEQDQLIKLLCDDWADDDTRIKEMCEPIVGKDFIDGDGYSFVCMLDVVEEVVKKYNNLKELNMMNFMSDMPPMEKLQKQRDDLKDRVKMLEGIIAKHTSIPKSVIPMLTTKFPEIVQSEITHHDPNSTEIKEIIEKCKPFFDYNTNNEISTLHKNNIE